MASGANWNRSLSSVSDGWHLKSSSSVFSPSAGVIDSHLARGLSLASRKINSMRKPVKSCTGL